jgi:membrane protein
VVQDGQPARGEEREQVRKQAGREVRRKGRCEAGVQASAEVRGEELAEERGIILGRAAARIRAVIESFAEDDCPFLAGAIAYQIFFALIPLLALLVGIVAFVYGPDRAERELVQVFRAMYPSATDQETRIARELVEGRGLSLSLGLIGTVFSSMAIHGSLESAIAAVLGREGRRALVRGRFEATAFVAALVLLAIVSLGLSGALGRAAPFLAPLAGLPVGFVFFYLVYWALPRRRIGSRLAAQAALVSALLWEVAKLSFGYFTGALGVFAAYGPLAFAAGLLTWIYLTGVIILVGAEVVKTRGAT